MAAGSATVAITLRYELREEHYADLVRAAARRLHPWRYWLILRGGFLASVMLLGGLWQARAAMDRSIFWPFGLGSIALLALLTVWTRWLESRRARLLHLRQHRHETILTLDEKGLEIESNPDSPRAPWAEVSGIVTTRATLIVFLQAKNRAVRAFPVPRECWPSEEQLRQIRP